MSRVHFANLTPGSESPMSDQSNSSFDTRNEGDLLQLTPAETILFQKSNGNELVGNVEILNVSKKPVTYKIKTTAPDKFRVRPSSGTLSPNKSAIINVVLQKGHQIQPLNRDKFLVMCIALPNDAQTADEITNLWKNVNASSTDVEQHRLKCAMPTNITTAIINNNENGDYYPDLVDSNSVMMMVNQMQSSNNGINGMGTNSTSSRQTASQQVHLQTTVSQLNDTVHRLESQVKFNQTLQWITIFVFLLLSIAIVYILKIEIQNSNSLYCIDNK